MVVAGTLLGIGGHLTAGRLVAFLFLVTLFVSPMQVATEVLNDAQNAIAGWRRVLGVLDTEPDVADPGEDGVELPRGAIEVAFENVSFAYPSGPTVLHGVSARIAPRARVAIVGETGSGKTTFAKLLTRLMDPVEGRVLIDGVPLTEIRFSSLRERIVMVPQDGFLFDATLADNIRYGRPGATDEDIVLALTELGLADWLEGLPAGIQSQVGQRGESCRRENASWWPWPAPTWPTRTCWYWTRPPRPWTRRRRYASSEPSRESPEAEPQSPSPTAYPPRRRLTRSSSSTRAA